MTPAQIAAAIKDIVIIAAVLFTAWWLYHVGQGAVRAQDLQAVQAQLEQNAKDVAAYDAKREQAEETERADLQTVATNISHNSAPVYIVRHPPGASPVCSVPAATSDQPASPGSSSGGPGSDSSAADIRPGLQRHELEDEQIVADCRRLYDSWPVNPTK